VGALWAAGDARRPHTAIDVAARLSRVRIQLTDEYVEVRLAPWQKLLGLMRNIRVARADVSDAHVVSNPVREAMHGGVKAGLRLPWLYYIARSIRLDEAFLVRRGVPGLCFSVDNGTLLHRVLISTRDAAELAHQLQTGED
jgi:hypothetical protein